MGNEALLLLKTLHVGCAYLTGAGFLLRGVLAIGQSRLLGHRSVRVVPHIIDTLLLGSALALLFVWSLSPMHSPWLLAKIVALLVYIAFGFTMLRWGTTPARRWIGLIGGALTYGYIVSVAHSKSPLGWLSIVGA